MAIIEKTLVKYDGPHKEVFIDAMKELYTFGNTYNLPLVAPALRTILFTAVSMFEKTLKVTEDTAPIAIVVFTSDSISLPHGTEGTEGKYENSYILAITNLSNGTPKEHHDKLMDYLLDNGYGIYWLDQGITTPTADKALQVGKIVKHYT